MAASDLTPRQLTLAKTLDDALRAVMDANEVIYVSTHVGGLKANAHAHDAGHAVAAFVKLYAHQLADQRAVLRNECSHSRTDNEDDLTAAAVHAHAIGTSRLLGALAGTWHTKVTDRIVGVGTAAQHDETRRVYQSAFKQLEAQAKAMNGWAAQEVLQDLDALLTRRRFDRYQAVATASAEITARAAKITAWTTVAIALLTLATLIQPWLQQHVHDNAAVAATPAAISSPASSEKRRSGGVATSQSVAVPPHGHAESVTDRPTASAAARPACPSSAPPRPVSPPMHAEVHS
jgi:hypothetical protein